MEEIITAVEPVVEEPEALKSAEPAEEPVAEATQPEAEPVDAPVEEPKRNLDVDARFAERRREKEAKQAERMAELFRKFDIPGETPEDVADAAEAHLTGKTVEEIKKQRAESERIAQLEAENKALREAQAERIFRDDLSAIRSRYPDAPKAIEELGDDFIRLRAAGVSPIVAYEAVKASAKPKNPVPPSTGAVKSVGRSTPEVFSREDVAAMSKSEVEKNLDKIMKDMQKWPT